MQQVEAVNIEGIIDYILKSGGAYPGCHSRPTERTSPSLPPLEPKAQTGQPQSQYTASWHNQATYNQQGILQQPAVMQQYPKIIYPLNTQQVQQMYGQAYTQTNTNYAQQVQYWESQNNEVISQKSTEKTEQYNAQQAYLKATPEQRKLGSFFRDIPIENVMDHQAIEESKRLGLYNLDPCFRTGKMSHELKQKIAYMKSKHRSAMLLRKWAQDGYWCRQNDILKIKDPSFTDTIERIHVNDLTVEQFIEKYEKGSKPVIIQGVTDCWPGMKEWQLSRLVQRFGNSLFKIGESDSGRKLKVTLKEYAEYALFGRDDSPLYMFEAALEDHPEAKVMVDEYTPVRYCQRDFFVELLGEDKAPPHRWFLIGPKRSGSEVHKDPLGTSAWNTSVAGHKRWVLMPPLEGISKPIVRGEHLRKKNEDDEAIQYFDKVLPRLKEAEGPQGTNRLPVIIEGIQYPGETIFVPSNWWHGVLNLDLTIAITQNFVNEGNFERVWTRTRKGRKKLSVRFLEKLKQNEPELYKVATDMNERDDFVMWDKREKYKHKFLKKSKLSSKEEKSQKVVEESSSDTISSSGSSSSSDSESSDGSSSSNSRDEDSDDQDSQRSYKGQQVLT